MLEVVGPVTRDHPSPTCPIRKLPVSVPAPQARVSPLGAEGRRCGPAAAGLRGRGLGLEPLSRSAALSAGSRFTLPRWLTVTGCVLLRLKMNLDKCEPAGISGRFPGILSVLSSRPGPPGRKKSAPRGPPGLRAPAPRGLGEVREACSANLGPARWHSWLPLKRRSPGSRFPGAARRTLGLQKRPPELPTAALCSAP